MIRTQILGVGSYVPERIVTNEELAFLNAQHERCEERQTDTSHEWIVQRTGIEERRYVPNDGSVSCSDLAKEASVQAIADAGLQKDDIDCIIFGTLSPDMCFPGAGVFLQKKLGLSEQHCPCYDIRQQCSAFVYGLQMANAFLQTGLYKNILLVGSELHSHSLDYTTRGRDVTALFGDGAGAFVLSAKDVAEDDKSGILFTEVHADGAGAMDLYLKVFEIAHVPYVWYDGRGPGGDEEALMKYPQMNGKKVFANAVRRMVGSVHTAMAKTGLSWDDIQWFVPHQANLRINQKVAEMAQIPPEKILNTIEFFGNTTAATIPLTIDHWKKQGKVQKGDRILSTVFGSGFTWGSAIFTI